MYLAGRLTDPSSGNVILFDAKYDSSLANIWNSGWTVTGTDLYGNSITASPGFFGGTPFIVGGIVDPTSGNTQIFTMELSFDGTMIVDQGSFGVTGDNVVGNGIVFDASMTGNNCLIVGTDSTVGDGLAASITYM